MNVLSPDNSDRGKATAPCGKEEIKLLLLETLDLPMLPVLMGKILKVSENGRNREKDMADVISADHALRDAIVEVANSPSFGLSQRVPGVGRAIKVLGYEAVRSLALGILVAESVCPRGALCVFDRDRFWAHALACAYLSKKIAAMTHLAEMETTFVCGLLHDIGKAFLAIFLPDSYRHVLTHVKAGAMTSAEREDEVLGFNHAEVGMWLAQRWRFPKPVIFTIANHHGGIEKDERYDSLTSILRLADHICLRERVSLEHRPFVAPLERAIPDALNLGGDDIAELRHALDNERKTLRSLV